MTRNRRSGSPEPSSEAAVHIRWAPALEPSLPDDGFLGAGRSISTMESIQITTDKRLEVREVTAQVREVIPDDITGTVTVFSSHTTAGVAVNEGESRLLSDFETALADLVPDDGWKHDQVDDNADSHIRSLLVGAGETIPVVDGELQLGTWQSILFVECDGPRDRTVTVVAE